MKKATEEFFKLERAVELLVAANDSQKEHFLYRLQKLGIESDDYVLRDIRTGVTVRRHDVVRL